MPPHYNHLNPVFSFLTSVYTLTPLKILIKSPICQVFKFLNISHGYTHAKCRQISFVKFIFPLVN